MESKCPLCGSSGDDLIFKFYCSNKDCANFVPEKPKGKPKDLGAAHWHVHPDPGENASPHLVVNEDGGVSSVGRMPFRIEKIERKPMTPPRSEIFFLGPPEFVGQFQKRPDIPVGSDIQFNANGDLFWIDESDDQLRRRLLATLRAPRTACDMFHSEYGCSFPPPEPPIPKFDLQRYGRRVLVHWRDKVPNVLTDLLSPLLGACRGHLEAYGPIRARLRMMAAFGELLWNQEKKRFELHFSE